ncbi:hypothetical protein J2S98_004729, partial [Arthrobacter oryzae]|nr:hypothetical protein [Arthrobacter oryzae]MDP9989538.1 hypothetical protein [Arthrobacter oryzae]
KIHDKKHPAQDLLKYRRHASLTEHLVR